MFIFINKKYIYFPSHSCNKLTKSWVSGIQAGTPAANVKVHIGTTYMLLKNIYINCKKIAKEAMAEVGWVDKYGGKYVTCSFGVLLLVYFFWTDRSGHCDKCDWYMVIFVCWWCGTDHLRHEATCVPHNLCCVLRMLPPSALATLQSSQLSVGFLPDVAKIGIF